MTDKKTYEELLKENEMFREASPTGVIRYVDRAMAPRQLSVPPKYLVHVYDDYTTDDQEEMIRTVEEFDSNHMYEDFVRTCEEPVVVYQRCYASKEFG